MASMRRSVSRTEIGRGIVTGVFGRVLGRLSPMLARLSPILAPILTSIWLTTISITITRLTAVSVSIAIEPWLTSRATSIPSLRNQWRRSVQVCLVPFPWRKVFLWSRVSRRIAISGAV